MLLDNGVRRSSVADYLAYHFGFDPYGPVRTGKRLRPQMVGIAADAFGALSDAWIPAAVAIELLHNYSLIHDDIEDHDELRHGRPTLWKRIGVAQALNAGDQLCALSFLALEQARHTTDATVVLAMVRRLHHAHRIMCDGQALDLAFESETTVELAQYRTMIACKTASLFGAAAELGVMAARNRDDADADVVRFREAGFAYGIAFQLRDDLLGIWADADTTGKAVAHDLARRKWSFPIVWALAQAPSAARRVIADAYALMRPLDRFEVEHVVEALDSLGARQALESEIVTQARTMSDHGAQALYDFVAESLEVQIPKGHLGAGC